MRFGFFFFVMLAQANPENVCAQKPIIDTSAFTNWQQVEQGRLSPSGAYIAYRLSVVQQQHTLSSALVVTDSALRWQLRIDDVQDPPLFSGDSRWLLFMNNRDSLGLLSLINHRITYLGAAQRNYEVIGNHLVYQLKNASRDLVIQDLSTRRSMVIPGVDAYVLNREAGCVVYEADDSSSNGRMLIYFPFATGKPRLIACAQNLRGYQLSQNGRFVGIVSNGKQGTAIECYDSRLHTSRGIRWVPPADLGGLTVSGIRSISNDGTYIVFDAAPSGKEEQSKSNRKPPVSIWNSQEVMLPTFTPDPYWQQTRFAFGLDAVSGRVTRLENANERLIDVQSDVALIRTYSFVGDLLESNWNNQLYFTASIVSLSSGKRQQLPGRNQYYTLAGDGKFIYYVGKSSGRFMVVDVQTKQFRDVTPQPLAKNLQLVSAYDSVKMLYLTEGYLESPPAVVTSDERDLWMIDLNDGSPAINMTKGNGRANNIRFHLPDRYPPRFAAGERVLLSAFNFTTKENGFYALTLSKQPTLRKLIIGPYLFRADGLDVSNQGAPPQCSKDGRVCLIQRMRAEDSPNLFLTRDFKSFKPVTAIRPEQKFNWLTATLVAFQTKKGNWSQGILYKPDNFDSTKRYPVIIHYYEQLSDEFHVFPQPETAAGNINIPWLVSRGYLVFTPDIYYQSGDPGLASFEHIDGAADYLAQLPFIDSTKMGLQGHSFGGYESYYALTQSHRFAAVCAGAGISNFLSHYGGLMSSGASRASSYEHGQFRMDATIWDMPEKFVSNSPGMMIDQVQTPILIMHNSFDKTVPFLESCQFFTGLRHLQKDAWLLDYGRQGHFLSDPAKRLDFTMRITAFFDHYLKGVPMPAWMQ